MDNFRCTLNSNKTKNRYPNMILNYIIQKSGSRKHSKIDNKSTVYEDSLWHCLALWS